MAIETKKVKVAEKSYNITTFPARKGLTYLNQLKTIIGPALALAFAGGDLEEGEVDSQSFSLAIQTLINSMDSTDVEALIWNMIKDSVTTANLQEIPSIDDEFSGRYDLLVGIIKEIINTNYGSIFLGSGGSDSPLKNLMSSQGQ